MHTRISLSTIFITLSIITVVFAGCWYALEYLLAPQKEIHARKEGRSPEFVQNTTKEIFATYAIPFSTETTQQVVVHPQTRPTIFFDLRTQNIEIYEIHTNDHTQWHIYSIEKREFVIELLDTTSTIAVSDKKNPRSSDILEPQDSLNSSMVSTNPSRQNTPSEVALVFTGIQSKNIDAIMEIKHPVNFAIVPTDPFALHQAHTIAQHFHEIVLDTRNVEHFYIDAVPYASGIIESGNTKTPSHWNHLVTNSIDNPNATLVTEYPFTNPQIQEKIVLIDISTIDSRKIVEWINEISSQVHLRLLSEVI